MAIASAPTDALVENFNIFGFPPVVKELRAKVIENAPNFRAGVKLLFGWRQE
ncbi:hypothetical protein [Aurantiacibacter sediminis]|uniref:hypothetical protein n=1 Tax=Aurantiacibacter sediminis TaxID=2793064 RepID=UPI0018D935A7|nr:hypothetical protein [Aurantiacibacter sediminis]